MAYTLIVAKPNTVSIVEDVFGHEYLVEACDYAGRRVRPRAFVSLEHARAYADFLKATLADWRVEG